ncbi:MAG TPA: GNAT family N-acetyltransferase [Bacillota bacterium]|nr:GNAT family N-acetyltransferase [Bacillota bacterium]
MRIREIQLEDAQRFLELCMRADGESEFLLYEKNERPTTEEEQRQSIQSFKDSINSTIFVVEDDYQLVGYLLARGGSAKKNRHSVYIVIAILQSHIGKGLGTLLFKKLEEWAREKGIHRLELGVMEPNVHAISLYKKMGFEIEGKKRNVFRMNDAYIDEYMMAKLLDY